MCDFPRCFEYERGGEIVREREREKRPRIISCIHACINQKHRRYTCPGITYAFPNPIEREVWSFYVNIRKVLYLDTTYCSPRYRFPPQQQSIELITSIVKPSVCPLSSKCDSFFQTERHRYRTKGTLFLLAPTPLARRELLKMLLSNLV